MASQDTMPQVALIAMIFVVLLTLGLGFYFMSQLGSVDKPESLAAERDEMLRKEEEVLAEIANLQGVKLTPLPKEPYRERRILAKVTAPEGKIAAERATITELDWKLKLVQKQLSRLTLARANLLVRRDIHDNTADKLESTRRQVERELSDGEYGLRTLRGHKDDMEQGFHERRSKLQASIDDAQKELTKAKNRYARRYEQKRNERSRLNTKLARAKDELEKASAREPIEVDVSADGIVLNSDIDSRLVVINIGEQQGVKRGMRFEVFQLRGGGRHAHKGYVDVRSVSRETASCIILDRLIRLPCCPGCGYTGSYAEEQYCPFCTGGGILFQRLRGSPRQTSLGMNPNDPIVVGDLLRNPLFDPEKKVRFAVKGDPLHTNFRTEQLMSAIRWHGGVIDPDVGAQTDVLLAGKWATEESRRARELGIRVLNHYELFNFLRK